MADYLRGYLSQKTAGEAVFPMNVSTNGSAGDALVYENAVGTVSIVKNTKQYNAKFTNKQGTVAYHEVF